MRRRSAGFTLVEVMVSLGVMTVGAMSIIAMQQQTTRANVHSREVTTATQIAQNVLERLKLEAIAWNTVTPSPSTDLLNAPTLRLIVGSTPGSFAALTPRVVSAAGVTRTLSNAFDYYGSDLNLTNADSATLARVHFCAGFRLSWIYANFRAMRADVRVFWAKDASGRTITTDFASCNDDNASLNPPNGANYDRYHIIYLSTVIRPAPI
jgi:prepilin-type N-terminal cleavage/methylation domain-containing protein